MRKIALLSGVAGALFITAPQALAQDAPPAPTQTQEQTQPAEQGSVSLQPGADVFGEGGVRLGDLEGVQTSEAGRQELTVRGDDGLLRAVPTTGFRLQDGDVFLAASLADYLASEVLEDPAQGQGDAVPPPPIDDPDPINPDQPHAPTPEPEG